MRKLNHAHPRPPNQSGLQDNAKTLTRNIYGGSSINDATVWANTVSARCGRLDFETHISICGVGQFQSSGDNICKRAWGRQRNKQWLEGVDVRQFTHLPSSLGTDAVFVCQSGSMLRKQSGCTKTLPGLVGKKRIHTHSMSTRTNVWADFMRGSTEPGTNRAN